MQLKQLIQVRRPYGKIPIWHDIVANLFNAKVWIFT